MLAERALFAFAALTPKLPESSVSRWGTPAWCRVLGNTPRTFKESRKSGNHSTESDWLRAGDRRKAFLEGKENGKG